MDDPIATAILETLTYADLFDFAMTPEEVFRFLIQVRATRAEIETALNDHARLNSSVARVDGFVTLPNRQALVAARRHLHSAALREIPRARFYARVFAHLPFVRMVALTGGLAMENARDGDIDYFIVTAPGRLWLVRGFAVALVRLARRFGDRLCPNFLLTQNALTLSDQNLYSAHEIVQMIPFYGFELYLKIRALNGWTERFLPNADGVDRVGRERPLNRVGGFFKRAAEWALGGTMGDWIERWEMRRKIAKLTAQIPATADAVTLSADACCGFFSGHGSRTLKEFQARVRELQMINDK
jgi:hypothetical protein